MEVITITLNGKSREVLAESSIKDLLDEMEYGKQAIVFLKGKKLLQKEYENTIIMDSDEIRIIKPLAGG